MVTAVQDQLHVKPTAELIQQIAQRHTDTDHLRIQLGRRIVYGELASGERRDELTPERIEAIAAAIQQPVSEGIRPALYARRVPNIEIRSGDEVLFRQEYTGSISINALLPEQQLSVTAQPEQSTASNRSAESPSGPILDGDQLVESVVQAQNTIAAVRQLVDPTGANQSQPLTTELGGYTFQAGGGNVAILNQEGPVLQAQDGTITQSNLTEEDSQALHGWLWRDDHFEQWTVPIVQPEATAADPPAAIAIAQQQIKALPDSRAKRFFQRLGEDIGQQAAQAVTSIRQGLESDQFKAIQNKVSTAAQEAPEKAAEVVGRGLEKAGQWIASRPEAIRDYRAMKIALNLFEQGYNRTHERSFEQGGFRVEFEGGRQLRLSEAQSGATLMRFQKEAASIAGQPPRLSLVEKAISRAQYQALEAVAQRREPVQGSPAAEASHAQKSEQIAQLSKGLAEAMGSRDYRGKHYRIEIGDDSLKISATDGRGEVYRREGEQVVSRFEQKDFGRFAQVLRKLESQSVAQATSISPLDRE